MTDLTVDVPALPRISLVKVLQVKAELERASGDYVGRLIDSTNYKLLCRVLTEALPGQFDQRTVEKSLLDLVGSVLLRNTWRGVCWRLAANMHKLDEFIMVPAWTKQTVLEWMPLQVVEAVKHYYSPKNTGAIFTFRILAGSAAGMLTHKFWTKRFCQYWSKELGFTAAYGDFPFAVEQQFVGLRLWGLFDPILCNREEGPKFDKVRVSSTLLERNKEIIQSRLPDSETYKCPLSLDIACHSCQHGTDHCPKATHPRTYIQQKCDTCQNEQAYHEPRLAYLRRCVDCDLVYKYEKSKERR